MKFLLHSWLQLDGIYTIYIYYDILNILDLSKNMQLVLSYLLLSSAKTIKK